MPLSACILPAVFPIKGLSHWCLLLLCLLGVAPLASAQKGRYLQTINLRDAVNRPYAASIHSLPVYLLHGVMSGEIRPYRVDYAAAKAEPFTAAAKESLLQQLSAAPDAAGSLSPRMLHQLDVDLTRSKGGRRSINYLHFHRVHVTDEAQRSAEANAGDYFFSVSFDQVAAYLTKQHALWVKNAGPLLWKNQVVHTYGQDAFSVLSNIIPELEAHTMTLHVALSLDPKGEIVSVGAYSWQHELVQEVALPDSLLAAGEILPMAEALQAGRYRVSREAGLKTKLPEVKLPNRPEPRDARYLLTQTEKLYLDHPANQAYLQPGQELPALLMEAVSKGSIANVYASGGLREKMSEKTWQDNLKVKEYDLFGEGYTLSELNHLPQAMSVLEVAWRLQVDADGNVISKTPHALGMLLGAANDPSGLEALIGYFSFEEVYRGAKADNSPKALLHVLDNIANQQYRGYLSHTSEMMVLKK